MTSEMTIGTQVTEWGPFQIPDGATLVRRDSLTAGDVVVSTHFGLSTVNTIFTRKSGVHAGKTELRFEDAGRPQVDRDDADKLIPLLDKEDPARERDGALWVHGLPATSFEQVASYLTGDAHDVSKVQVYVDGRFYDIHLGRG